MFIQTEATPNPDTLKFLPGVEVMGEGRPAMEFHDRERAAATSPLAAALLAVEGVESIFLGADFISVTRRGDWEWDILRPLLLTAMMDHFVAGKPVCHDGGADASAGGAGGEAGEDDDLTRQIRELIDTRVRPAVAMDGGDIVFRSFKDGVVELELYGACSGCPSSTMTLKDGIENMLKHYVPEVERVEAVA